MFPRLPVLLLLLLPAVQVQSADPPASPPSSSTNQQIYQVKGVIKEVMRERKKVIIDHEEIPGYMEAMTMQLDVKDEKELSHVQPGDAVTFRMIVTDDDGWIDQIRRLETQPPPRPSAPPLYRVVREVESLAVGDRLPDYRLTNELGQAVNLADFRSRALGITFIFTRCPFPTYCPRMSSQFAQVQHALLTAPAGPTNWHLLTVSFDPEFDTPAVLKAYAKRWKADARRWNFLTGALIDITALTEQFGLTFWRPDPYNPGSINHNIRTVVVDPEGRIRKIIAGNEWKPAELVEAITQAARAVSSPPSP